MAIVVNLLPCPFCGNQKIEKLTAPFKGTQMFVCDKCGADVCFYGAEYEPKASQAWNRRAGREEKENTKSVRCRIERKLEV